MGSRDSIDIWLNIWWLGATVWRVAYQVVQHSISLTKIFFIFSLICFLPQLFIVKEKDRALALNRVASAQDFKLAVQLISSTYIKDMCPKQHPTCALLTNHAAHLYAGKTSRDLLAQQGIKVDAVFELKDIAYQELAAIMQKCNAYDLLFVDVQDTGQQTVQLVHALIAAAASDLSPQVVVLDRPNLFGPKIEGSLYALNGSAAEKFPLRLGMTIGELMHYYMARMGKKVPIHVVAMQNYDRNIPVPAKEPASSLQQNIYSFTLCDLMAQIQPFDVGVATEYAHSVIALPQEIDFCKKNWYELQVQLRNMAIESSICSYYSPIKKTYCTGLKLHIQDIFAVDSFNALLVTLLFFKQSGLPLGFTQRFDDLVGTPIVRQYIEGKMSRAAFKYAINHELEQFYRQAFNAFMYHPLPQVVMV